MVGVLKSTQKRYAYALLCFFKWRRIQKLRHPKTYDEVDNILGEYVNYLFQVGKPQYLGYDVVSAMRRYCPQSKASLNTAKTFLANWTSIIERRKALPLSPSMVRAMAGFALLRGQSGMGLLLLLSFLSLLRVSEALGLEVRDFTFLGTREMLLFLRDTKTSRQQNSSESVRIRDHRLCDTMRRLLAGLPSNTVLFPYQYGQVQKALTEFGLFFGLRNERLTTHSLRRGGASHFFKSCGSYDETQQQGRWAQLRTARGYIDAAVADAQQEALPPWAKERLAKAEKSLPSLLTSLKAL